MSLNKHNPHIHEKNREFTIGQMLDRLQAAQAPTYIIKDFLPDGTPYMMVLVTGDSAISLNQVIAQLTKNHQGE